MERKYVNLIYLDKESNKFAFIFLVMFLLLPNMGVVIALFLMYGKEIVKNNALILPVGIYTIFNAMMIIISFFSMENNKEKSIKILEEGISYNSLLKKFAVPWNLIHRVQVNPFMSARPTIVVHTEKGRFHFTGMFVNADDEIPKIKPGFIKPKFYYPSGGKFDGDIYKNELYLTLKEQIPDKFY